jgi:hypothetical protein
MPPNLRTPLTPFLSIFITGFLACIILVMTVGHSPAQQDVTTGEITVPSGGDSKINVNVVISSALVLWRLCLFPPPAPVPFLPF